MNADALSKNYPHLTPQERFQLILAAGERGDHTEQDRLKRAGQKLTLVVGDHTPWSQAFEELATVIYMEALDDAASHRSLLMSWGEASEMEDQARGQAKEDHDDGIDDAAIDAAIAAMGHETEDDHELDEDDPDIADDDHEDETPADRLLNLYLAQGFTFQTKIAGWCLFCERMRINPFSLWSLYPGYERLQLAIELVERRTGLIPPAFAPLGMLRWLTRIRPAGEPKPRAEQIVTPESMADSLEEAFRQRVAYWGG